MKQDWNDEVWLTNQWKEKCVNKSVWLVSCVVQVELKLLYTVEMGNIIDDGKKDLSLCQKFIAIYTEYKQH